MLYLVPVLIGGLIGAWNPIRCCDQSGASGKKASIVGLPLQSLVLSPEDGTTIPSLKTVRTEGIAFSGGTGNRITGVEVSLDRGKSWHPATINRDEVPATSTLF